MNSSAKTKRSRKKTELAFVVDARSRIKKAGIPCKWEAPLLGRSVDLVFYKDEAVCSVEFKLKNWRRACEQAKDHQLGVDYAYICLPTKTVTETIRMTVAQYGIGVLEFCKDGAWPFKVLMKASRSSVLWPAARNRLLKIMEVI